MFDTLFEKLGKTKSLVVVTTLVVLDVVIFAHILGFGFGGGVDLYFFDVGQGDSQLINVEGVQVLIDGGPVNGRALASLSGSLGFTDRYIDLVVMTHPQEDHFGGLIDVLNSYKVGAFVYSGRSGSALALKGLEEAINKNKTPAVELRAGDVINYKGNKIKVLSPESGGYKEVNEDSMVLMLESNGARALFAGDIGRGVERGLIEKYDLDSSVLKVPHHGSKFSSSKSFLASVNPAVSIIQVGENSYGHPTDEVLSRLKSVGSRILRNDIDGTVRLKIENGVIKIFKSGSAMGQRR